MQKVAGRLRLELAQYRELEAFSQFGSELDPATQQALARGERMVATLNQPQYKPWPHAEQVVALYAGIHGWLDEIPVPQVPRFQDELRETCAPRAAIYEAIDETGRPRATTPWRSSTRCWRSSVDGFNVEEKEQRGLVAAQMASVQDLKRRIRSVRNTRKITRAMELVAAAKLRRAQARIEAMRPYADTMRELIAGVGRAAARRCAACRCSSSGRRWRRSRSCRSPAIEGWRAPSTRRCCDGRSRSSRQLAAEGKQVRWLAVGKKGRSTLAFRRYGSWTATYVGFTDRPAYADAQAIAPSRRRSSSPSGEVDRVVLVYNTFVSRAHAAGDRAGASCRSRPTSSRRTRRSAATTRCAATSSSSPSRRRSWRGCCPSTSRRRSTARCSSRPRPSRARG